MPMLGRETGNLAPLSASPKRRSRPRAPRSPTILDHTETHKRPAQLKLCHKLDLTLATINLEIYLCAKNCTPPNPPVHATHPKVPSTKAHQLAPTVVPLHPDNDRAVHDRQRQ